MHNKVDVLTRKSFDTKLGVDTSVQCLFLAQTSSYDTKMHKHWIHPTSIILHDLAFKKKIHKSGNTLKLD